MSLDQRIRKLGAPLYGLSKKMGLSLTRKQSSVVRTNSQVVRASKVDFEPSATFRQVPPPPSLPVELWTKIIHELGHREWMALCRVCWLFYQIAQPCLHENIVLHAQENVRHEISDGSFGDPFRRTINQRPELGAYVRSLVLDMYYRPEPDHEERYPLLFELHLFPNLERLEVLHAHIDLELCNIFHSHPRLKSVTVDSCTLDESLAIGHIDQDNFPHSSISTAEMLSPKHNPLFHAQAALAPAKLESLAVRFATFPASDGGLLLNRIMELNKISFLTTLSLNTFSPAVVRFLIASPQLRHFILGSWSDGYNLISSSLPADAIPSLEEYDGPAQISSTFFRGRPVHTVKFIFLDSIPEDRLVEILISLRYSAVPLTSVGLILWNATVGSWLSHIPVTVRHLTLDYMNWRDFDKWLPALSHLTSLRTLSGKFDWQRGKLHRDEIIQISNTCQSLAEMDIGPQKWRISGKRVWEPFTEFMG